MVYTYLWSTIGDGILLFHSHWWSKQLHSSSSVFVMFILCVWSTMEVSIQIWVNYNNSLTWIVRPFEDDFPKINHDSQWGRSEVAIIYPDTWNLDLTNICIYIYIEINLNTSMIAWHFSNKMRDVDQSIAFSWTFGPEEWYWSIISALIIPALGTWTGHGPNENG